MCLYFCVRHIPRKDRSVLPEQNNDDNCFSYNNQKIKVAIMCLQAIRCNIQEFCCNGLLGVTWSYIALQGHLVSVTAIFFAVMSKLPVT
jgi:hypothetical protein